MLLILLKEWFVIIFHNACRVLDWFSAFLIAATDFVATDFVHRSEKKYWGGFRQTQRSLAYQKNIWMLSGRKWNQPSEWRPAGQWQRPDIEWCYRLLRFHSREMGLDDGQSVNDIADDLFSIKLVWFWIESRSIFDDHKCLNSLCPLILWLGKCNWCLVEIFIHNIRIFLLFEHGICACIFCKAK